MRLEVNKLVGNCAICKDARSYFKKYGEEPDWSEMKKMYNAKFWADFMSRQINHKNTTKATNKLPHIAIGEKINPIVTVSYEKDGEELTHAFRFICWQAFEDSLNLFNNNLALYTDLARDGIKPAAGAYRSFSKLLYELPISNVSVSYVTRGGETRTIKLCV